ncbi:hypothetical protein ACO2Q8_07590 [Larkinella sp. VNQ87]|uniref:hypothetical protein n=1 Tax=Larkinella sp. VNQ87 TaxID=3400921 RepID=UPI003C03A3E7
MKRILIMLLVVSHTALAQTTDSTQFVGLPPKTNFKVSWMTELGIMLTSTSMPNIRSYYRANGTEPDSHLDPFINLGFGARYQRVKLMIQAGYGLNFSLPNDDVTRAARQQKAGFTGVMLGFDVANTRNRRLYLNLGYGSIGYEHNVYRRTDQTVPFENLTQYSQPGNIPSLRLTNNYWDVNLEYTQREKRKESAQSVIRIGYRRGFESQRWQSDAFRLTGGPTDRISQFYFQATYYFSSNHPKKGN